MHASASRAGVEHLVDRGSRPRRAAPRRGPRPGRPTTRRSPSGGGSRSPGRAVVRPPPRRRRRGARWPCRSRRGGHGRPAPAAARSAAAVRSPWFSRASPSPWSRAAAQASRSGPADGPAGAPRCGGPACDDPHHREAELRRGGEPGQEALERVGMLAELEALGRAPREAQRDVAGLGEERSRRELGRVAEEARLQQREVELEPARLRHDVERPAREHVQRRRLAAPDLAEQAVVGVAVHPDAGRHHRAGRRDVAVVLASVPAMLLASERLW